MAAFSQARAPGIYKGEYLKELFRRYGDEEDAPPAPELPEWCFEDDNDGEVDDDGNAVGQESGPSSSGSASGKRKKEKLKLVRLPGSTRKWTVKWGICLPPPPMTWSSRRVIQCLQGCVSSQCSESKIQLHIIILSSCSPNLQRSFRLSRKRRDKSHLLMSLALN